MLHPSVLHDLSTSREDLSAQVDQDHDGVELGPVGQRDRGGDRERHLGPAQVRHRQPGGRCRLGLVADALRPSFVTA
ncbi:MAG: hypothetical protein ABIU87_01660 [Ornithinibacter sp.]